MSRVVSRSCNVLARQVRPAYPTPHRGSHKGVPLQVLCKTSSFRRKSESTTKHHTARQTRNVGARPCGCPGARRGTPDAPRPSTSHCDVEPGRRSARNIPSFQTQNPVIPSATSVIPSGARNLGVVREVWRLGALGVPRTAPGQPQGRAPTGCRPPLPFGHFPHEWGQPLAYPLSFRAERGISAWCARSGGQVRLAYPTPHRGSHKGVPLRCCLAYRFPPFTGSLHNVVACADGEIDLIGAQFVLEALGEVGVREGETGVHEFFGDD